MVYKIRKGLQEAIRNLTPTEYIRGIIVSEMIEVFSTHFGGGQDSTVATENS